MATIYRGQSIFKFIETFENDSTCKNYIANEKWSSGYTCRKCNHKNYCYLPAIHGRECTSCHYQESATANTLFHKVRFGLKKALCIVYEMSTTSKSMSSIQIAKRYEITQKTAWFFMQKVRKAMKSSQNHPLTGLVYVDEFVFGGKESGKQGRSYNTKKKKVVCAIELTEERKIKRGYAVCIPDYSSKSLKTIFQSHIDKNAQVVTDEWNGYKPIGKEYTIEQQKSVPGVNFKEIHTIISSFKSWVRTIPTHVDKKHTKGYLDEYFYRLNRSAFKETIFENLFKRLVAHQPVSWNQIVLNM